MKISGCIIARNEKDNIGNCISSLKRIVDEIIVVDTGSEDNTVQIAEELGAVVYEHKWENDFSKAKNIALDHANGDWIIYLDADEYFSEDYIPKVRPAIQKIHEDRAKDGILCKIINMDKDTNRSISIDVILRIFRNNRDIRYINKIHEEIRKSGVPLNCFNARDVLTIMHTGYSASILADKVRRNLDIIISSRQEDEKTAYYLATSYYMMEDYEKAYQYAELALANDAIVSRDILAYKLYLIRISATMKLEISNSEKVRRLIGEANQKYSRHPEIAKIEAAFLFHEKRYGNALEKYLYALECQRKYGDAFEQNDFEASIEEVYCQVARILYFFNEESDALAYYVRALQTNQYYPAAFDGVLSLCRTVPEIETIALFNSIYNVENKEDVKFIASHLSDCGRPKIVLYYADKWNNAFGEEDDVLIYALASLKKYSEALEIALIYLGTDREKYSPLVTSIILMGQLYSEADSIKSEIGADYFELIRCCEEGRRLSANNKSYIRVFSLLVKHAEQYDLHSYLKISPKDADTDREIAKVFFANKLFSDAITYYHSTYSSVNGEELDADVAFIIGYCYYKLKRWQDSLCWLEKANKCGYIDNDLRELSRCIGDQASDSEIKRKADTLLALSNGMS